MKINYELDEFEATEIQQIESELRNSRIPFLMEGNQLLIDKSDEPAVDIIISLLGTVHSPATSPAPPSPYVDDNPMHPFYRDLRYVERQQSKELSAIRRSSGLTRSKITEGGISFIGAVIGAIFGILLVVAQFQDPNYQGRVYLVLPAIIFGGIGLFVGSGIENMIRKFQGK